MRNWFSVKTIAALSTSALLVACGGGSGGGGSGSGQSSASTPNVNASVALNNFLNYTTYGLKMTSNDSYITSGTLIIRDADAGSIYPFVVGNVKNQVAKIKEISLNGDDKYLVLRNRYNWQLHLDSNNKPVGLSGFYGNPGQSDGSCVAESVVNNLPTSTNSSGVWFSGLSGLFNYHETARASFGYAHYCDVASTNTTKSIDWSIENGTPNPYFCVTFPAIDLYIPKTRVCLSTNTAGALTYAPWVTEYKSDGTVAREFKNTTTNSPK